MTKEASQLREYLDVACEAARQGAAVLEHWRTSAERFQITEKGRCDLVTDADLGSQTAIRTLLSKRFPTHGFLGEEDSGPRSRPKLEDPPMWIVDPLDGTTNYVHDVPMYCVSIGLYIAGELVVGVVLDPSRPELFAAAKGMGACLNGRPIRVSSAHHLDSALLATGFPPDMRGQEKALEWWRYFSLRTRSLRRTGSTALNLAYVAAGRFDGFWGFDNHVWDVAGGAVLVSEAGGVITNSDGAGYDPFRADQVASNGPLQSELLAAFQTEN